MTITHFEFVRDVLDELAFNNWIFHAAQSDDRVYLYVTWRAPDNFSPAGFPAELQHSRRWLIRPDASQSEVVQTAFMCVMTAMEHETREQFLYRRRAIFGPHHGIDSLWQISSHMEKV